WYASVCQKSSQEIDVVVPPTNSLVYRSSEWGVSALFGGPVRSNVRRKPNRNGDENMRVGLPEACIAISLPVSIIGWFDTIVASTSGMTLFVESRDQSQLSIAIAHCRGWRTLFALREKFGTVLGCG